jgi:hypothetical protein
MVECYGVSDPSYIIKIKINGGKKNSIGFKYMFERFTEQGVKFTLTAYDSSDVPTSSAVSVSADSTKYSKSCADLDIVGVAASFWNLNQNIISIHIGNGGGGNGFWWNTKDATGRELKKGYMLNADTDHYYTSIPTGGSIDTNCEAPVKNTNDGPVITWDDMIGRDAASTSYQFELLARCPGGVSKDGWGYASQWEASQI